MQNFGGQISWRAGENGVRKPYEVNIALFDALQGTTAGPDEYNIDRFICAHAIMLALEGIPAFYIHSLTATGNDHERFARTEQNRAINRHQWDYEKLKGLLADTTSQHSIVYTKLQKLIKMRREHKAFHPNATQFTLHMTEKLFGFWRQSMDRRESIFCIYNISNETQSLLMSDLNLIVTDSWHDLISGQAFDETNETIELAPYQVLWICNS
jgi:sucrose phosphorylase